MALSWSEPKTDPSPFDASVGETFAYAVHFARSSAVSDSEIESDLAEAIHKALPFARAATGERATKWLLLWDVVECDLTVVCSGDSMRYDSEHVVKCYFEGLEAERYGFSDDEFDQEASKRSAVIKGMLGRIVGRIDVDDLPVGKPVLYSDEDRASIGAEGFAAQVSPLP